MDTSKGISQIEENLKKSSYSTSRAKRLLKERNEKSMFQLPTQDLEHKNVK